MKNGDYMKNEEDKGFTLLETLIALILLMISATFFSTIIFQTTHLFNPKESQHYNEWQTFLLQLENEVKEKELITANDHVIVFEEKAESAVSHVSYEWYRQKIRKRRNNAGHHVLLTDVLKWKVSYNTPNRLTITVHFTDGYYYSGSMIVHAVEK